MQEYTLTAVAATGYTFEGWYTDSKVSSELKPTVNPAGATTYYAYYKAHQYTIKFDANGGTGSMSNQSHTYGVSKALKANAFIRTGYKFEGWNTKADGSGTSYADKASVKNLSSTNGATVNLYAQWTLNTYTVKWFVNGVELTGAETTVAHGNKVTTIPEVDLNTYCEGSDVLAGWIAAPMENASVAAPANLYKTIEDFPIVEGPQTYYAVFANYKE